MSRYAVKEFSSVFCGLSVMCVEHVVSRRDIHSIMSVKGPPSSEREDSCVVRQGQMGILQSIMSSLSATVWASKAVVFKLLWFVGP